MLMTHVCMVSKKSKGSERAYGEENFPPFPETPFPERKPHETNTNKDEGKEITTYKIWTDLALRTGAWKYLAVQPTEAALVSHHIPRSLQEMWSEKAFL